jgi:hypothetical protein
VPISGGQPELFRLLACHIQLRHYPGAVLERAIGGGGEGHEDGVNRSFRERGVGDCPSRGDLRVPLILDGLYAR